MTQNNEVRTETPVSESAIENAADHHRVDETIIRDALEQFQAMIDEHDLTGQFDDYHDYMGEQSDVHVWLTAHGGEVDEIVNDIDCDQLENLEHVSAGSVVRYAMDYDATHRLSDVFDGRQKAVDAVGAADALIAHK